MATPLIRVMNGHIYRVPNRRKRKPELKPSEIPTLLGYTASWLIKMVATGSKEESWLI